MPKAAPPTAAAQMPTKTLRKDVMTPAQGRRSHRMCQIRSMAPRNEAVLRYLEVERVAPPGTKTVWVIDGYSLATHPDLCERVDEVNTAAGNAAELRALSGKPALVTADDVIVAFGGGTYVFAVRLPRNEVDPRLLGKIHS